MFFRQLYEKMAFYQILFYPKSFSEKRAPVRYKLEPTILLLRYFRSDKAKMQLKDKILYQPWYQALRRGKMSGLTPIRINMMRNTLRANVSSAIKKQGISIAGINTSRLTLNILGIVFRLLKLNLSLSFMIKDKPKVYGESYYYFRECRICA